MDHQNSNSSIQCSVTSCSHNNREKYSCSLNSIKVGNCGPSTSSPDCTECASFELGKDTGSH